ncbi:hypothetical protein [Nitrincola iocasae]|uniref:Lipoprotein n=1 Tax=Nitrincola iocasae TaxID=2614693 RepID=A0A5J6LH01_9GAMM|nr:hypothetical protein [Nitrincola iocasae]QEW07889.1 hypothetical protein F5I99_16095 [Nitrincola iocasae]
MKNNALIGILLLSIILSGCASPARFENMLAVGSPEQRSTATPLRENISVADVTGGKETNLVGTSQVSNISLTLALQESLRHVRLFAKSNMGKYYLIAHMVELEQPLTGTSMTVTPRIHYTVIDRETGQTIYNRTITTPYTAAFSDALSGASRLRLANEGAIRVNIEALVNDLVMLEIDK